MTNAEGDAILFWTCSRCGWAFVPNGTPPASDEKSRKEANSAFQRHACDGHGQRTQLAK